jgi:hypothetical protein
VEPTVGPLQQCHAEALARGVTTDDDAARLGDPVAVAGFPSVGRRALDGLFEGWLDIQVGIRALALSFAGVRPPSSICAERWGDPAATLTNSYPAPRRGECEVSEWAALHSSSMGRADGSASGRAERRRARWSLAGTVGPVSNTS